MSSCAGLQKYLIRKRLFDGKLPNLSHCFCWHMAGLNVHLCLWLLFFLWHVAIWTRFYLKLLFGAWCAWIHNFSRRFFPIVYFQKQTVPWSCSVRSFQTWLTPRKQSLVPCREMAPAVFWVEEADGEVGISPTSAHPAASTTVPAATWWSIRSRSLRNTSKARSTKLQTPWSDVPNNNNNTRKWSDLVWPLRYRWRLDPMSPVEFHVLL